MACVNAAPTLSTLPRLRRNDRGLSFLRRLAGNKDGTVRTLPRLFELPGMRLHAQSAGTRTPVWKTVGEPEKAKPNKGLICRVEEKARVRQRRE